MRRIFYIVRTQSLIKVVKHLCITCAMLVCSSANAVLMHDLYTFNTIVYDNSHATRLDLLPTAFDQVLLKVAGTKVILTHPKVLEAKQNIDKYVRDFAYREGENQYKLMINFDDDMLDRLVAASGRASLSKNRPLVITWLVIQDNQPLDFVTQGSYADIAEYIDQSAQQHGIPIVLPLLDLTERLFVKPEDVAAFNEAPLQQAAGRYNADLVLAGKIQRVGDVWRLDCQLYTGAQALEWSSQGADLNVEIDQMLEVLADNLLAHYAKINRPTVSKKEVMVRVHGVQNVDDYAKIVKYLLSLSPIKKVDLSSIDENQAIFSVAADGGLCAIKTAVALDRVLVDEGTDISVEYLNYRVNS